MTAHIFIASATAPGRLADLANDDDVYVAKGVTIGSTSDDCIYGFAFLHSMVIEGAVVAARFGINLNGDPASSRSAQITVRSEGSVTGFSNAGMSLIAFDSLVDNAGKVWGSLYGLAITGVSSTTRSAVTNSGLIEGGTSGIGRFASTESFFLTNVGIIKGGSHSFDVGLGNTAVERIVNKGDMVGDVALGGGNDVYDGRLGSIEGKVLGGDGNDALYGGKEDNVISGGAGRDTLIGGLGADVFVFDAALSSSTNVDRLIDFANASGNNDTFHLDNAVFAALTNEGALAAKLFKDLSAGALDADDRILYDRATGDLFYDRDGTGATASILFAHLDTKPVLTVADFVVI